MRPDSETLPRFSPVKAFRLSSPVNPRRGSNGAEPLGREEGSASLFAGIRRSSLWSLLEDSGETSFSNRNEPFRFEEEEPPSDTEFSQYYGSAETERATCASTWSPWRVFAFFRRAAKEGRSRRSEISFVLSPSPPQRAILRAFCGFAVYLCSSTAAKRLRRRMFTAPMLEISSILIWV